MVRNMYVERQEQFETYMMNQTIPSLKALKLIMEKLADGDSEPIMTYINSFECNLPELLDQMNNLISRLVMMMTYQNNKTNMNSFV